MNINETNYENYFLLYIDKELSAAEIAAVESFVIAHPAYADELEQLKKTIQAQENIIFDNKALLYRLPELEASMAPDFKNTLYKKPAINFSNRFNGATKATFLSIAAIFLLLMGYSYIVRNNNSDLLSTPKSIVQNNVLIQPSIHNPIEKKEAIVFSEDKKQIRKEEVKNNTNSIIKTNQVVTTKEANFKIDLAPIVKGFELNEKYNASHFESTAIHQAPAIEPAAVMVNQNETNSYQVVDTDETDRSIYIANFEIDGAAIRGITRKFNAIFKGNKSDKK
jgi:hypothetical protein